MEEVAEEALVSRATAYRYFPSMEALLVEAPLDIAVPDPEQMFADDSSVDPAENGWAVRMRSLARVQVRLQMRVA